MPRFNCAKDAAIWDGCTPEPAYEPAPPPHPESQEAPATQRDGAILQALNQIQMLSETLAETNLDDMQQELVQFLLDTGMVLRREVLGAEAVAVKDSEEVELDDMAPPLEVRLGAQDYLDFECGDEIYIARGQHYSGIIGDDPLTLCQLPPNPSLEEDLIVEDIAMDDPDFAAASSVAEQSRPLDSLNFLIADSNAAHQSAARYVLEELGAQCSLANVGDVAELARMRAWDAILIDVQMPGRAGLSAIRGVRAEEISAHKPRAHILAFLSPASPEHVRECLQAGADGYLPRPLTAAAALEQFEVLAIERSLERRSA